MKQRLIFILLLLWLGWHLAVPNDFVRSDLGRHIKNGELLIQGHWDVLYKNFYSYTNPEYPFINHHWLFGVFCFVGWHYLGFTGLSFLYWLLELLTFYVFFQCWQRYSSFAIACAFGLLSIPFISARHEVRPEGISYLLGGVYWWLIDLFQQGRIRSRYLTVCLCALQIIWVNVHIFFILGPVLTFVFGWQAYARKEKEHAGALLRLTCLLCFMCLVNPSGISGALTPFHIDKAYTYLITENLSVFHALRSSIFPYKPLLVYFLLSAALLMVGIGVLIRREGFKDHIFTVSLTVLLTLMAVKAIRLISLFGFFWLPFSIYVYGRLMRDVAPLVKKRWEVFLVVLGIIVSATVNVDWKVVHGLGIKPGVNEAAQFFKQAKLAGPVFNNYSIGGYLIFHLSPEHRLFVDDRLEAYPKDFFAKTFVPMQTDDEIWHRLDRRYHFNVIFYAPDKPDWEGGFVLKRLQDREWGLVYHDDATVIFLRCNARNLKLFAQPFC